MSNVDPKFIKIIAELKAQFPDISSQDLGELALRYYELENQKTVNNFTQPPQAQPRRMSKREYEIKLKEIDSRISSLEVDKKFSHRKKPSDIKRIDQSLDELHQLRNKFIAEFAMNTYDDSSFESGHVINAFKQIGW